VSDEFIDIPPEAEPPPTEKGPDAAPEAQEKEEVDPALLEKALALLKSVAKGNGINTKNITLHSFEGEVLNYEAYHHFRIEPDVAEKLLMGKKGGDIVAGSEQDMRARITAFVESATENPVVIENTIDILKKRKDLGFAIPQHRLLLERMNKTIAVHEVCTVCSGSAKILCMECKGKGEIVCTRCHGSNEIICPECQGRQFMQGPDGKQVPCHYCHSRGKIGCEFCRGKGEIHCPKCKATGKMPCKDCGDTGWHTLFVSLKMNAISNYDYPKEELPEDAIEVIDDLGKLLVIEEHAKVKIIEEKDRLAELNAETKDNEFILPYHVRLPWGDIVFKIGEKDLKGNLFGFQPSLIHIPNFLEGVLGRGLRSLTEAAKGTSLPAGKIKEATKYRAVSEAVLFSARYSRKRAMGLMRKKYPFGITGKTIDKMVIYADTALKRVTDKPRKIGLAIGLCLVCLFYGFYYVGPLRDILISSITSTGARNFIDLLMILFGGAITTLSIQMTATKAMLEAIGDLLPKDKKSQFLPRPGYSALWGYGGGLAIYFLMIEIAAQMDKEIPAWYQSIRASVGL
jgi:hypothetical protein